MSCAQITGGAPKIKKNQFMYQLPMMNNEIWGNLVSEHNNLNKLPVKNYKELINFSDVSEQYNDLISFVNHNIDDSRFELRKNNFIVCMKSSEYEFIICDDAKTKGLDYKKTGENLPEVTKYYQINVNKH